MFLSRFEFQISDGQGQKRSFFVAKIKSLKTTTFTAIFNTQRRTYDI